MIDFGGIQHVAEPSNGAYITIAIDGRGASGKSALAEFLGQKLKEFTVINGDDYFEPHTNKITWGEFNEERFLEEVLLPIKMGLREFAIRPFDFPNGALGQPKQIKINQGVIIERCFSFELPIDWDGTIWVETPKEICLERGLQREGAKMFGKRATAAWSEVWQPRESRYITEKTPMRFADYVVNGTQPFEEQEWVEKPFKDRRIQ